MFSIKKQALTIFFSVFLFHGAFYYIFPEYHYLETGGGGWISYIKYLCMVASLPLLVASRFSRPEAVWIVTGWIIIFAILVPSIFWIDGLNLLLIQFTIPVFSYFFAGSVLKYFSSEFLVKKISLLVLIFISLFLVFEFTSGGLVQAYSRSGVRVAGPFLNPNNTGIVVALAAAIFHYFERCATLNFLVALLAIFAVVITGSKTALLVYFACFFLTPGRSWKVVLISFTGIVLFAYLDLLELYWDALELRDFSTESGSIRINDASVVLAKVMSGTFADFLFGFTSISVVDNSYLDILSFGGIFALVPFIVFQLLSVYLCIKNRYKLILLLHLMIFVAMLTTNIPRLWPVAYVYWLMIGVSIYKSIESNRIRFSPIKIYERKYNVR